MTMMKTMKITKVIMMMMKMIRATEIQNNRMNLKFNEKLHVDQEVVEDTMIENLNIFSVTINF